MLHEVEDIAFQVLFSNNSKVEDIFKSWKNRLLATEVLLYIIGNFVGT